jgi:pimeloyl-ACP methyl ester carboxylesterase
VRKGVCALSLAVLLIGRIASAEERITLPTRPGVTETVLFLPAPQPVASIIFFPGGNGVIAGEPDNFVLRIRDRFPAEGLTVVVLDAPSDQAGGITIDFRAGPSALQDAAAVIAFLRDKAPVPVWLLGTSNGTVSAANVAAHIGPPQLAGLVLTSSVWSGGMSEVPLDQIAVPVLVVHNRDDDCRLSPFAGASAGLAALVKAPTKELLVVSGGRPAGPPCKAHSPHGYYGIEDHVVPPAIAWIKAHPPAAR